VHYRLADGKEFKSPSAAGMAITGKSCNGWAFWSLETANYPSFDRSSPDRGQCGSHYNAKGVGTSRTCLRSELGQEVLCSHAESEGCSRGIDPQVLPRLRQELCGHRRRGPRHLPSRAQTELDRRNGASWSRQTSQRGLPLFVLTTNPSISRGYRR
jgi:hypothetical protein